MNTFQPRQPAGSPTGGQFSGKSREDADLDLSDSYREEYSSFGVPDDPFDPEYEQKRIDAWRSKLSVVNQELDSARQMIAELEPQHERLQLLIRNAEKRLENTETPYRGPHHVDETVVRDGKKFKLLDGKRFPDAPQAFRIQLSNEMTPDQARHLATLAAYQYAATAGEQPYGYRQDSPNSIILDVDTTKNRAYRNLHRFLDPLQETIAEETPIRKTDRMGAGTAGTRKHDGLGWTEVHIYADDVY